MLQKIEIGVEPYEVVLGEPKLTVRSQSPLDPETARGALTLANGFRGSVALSRDGRDRTVHTATDARFGDTGLFYAYTATGPYPGRIHFVPWRSLPLRP